MSLINSKVRFAVEEDTGKIFDYLTSRHLHPVGIHTAPDGIWDLAKLKHAILNGLNIHTALVKLPPPVEGDKVVQANKDFEKTVDDATKAADATPSAETPPAAETPAADPPVDPAAGAAAPAA